MLPNNLPELAFDPKLDIGHFLTFLTLAAGFTWWLYTTVRSWREKSNQEARNGALRLILKLLRERGRQPIYLDDLYDLFCGASESLRRAYCGKLFRFKSKAEFEAAVYRLDYEGKIDFITPHSVVFRVDGPIDGGYTPNSAEAERALQLLSVMLTGDRYSNFERTDMIETCLRIAPEKTRALLSSFITGTDESASIAALVAMRKVAQPARYLNDA